MSEQGENSSNWQSKAVLVNGSAKSGTTLVASLLDSHPGLLMLPKEVPFFTLRTNEEGSDSTADSSVVKLQAATSRLSKYIEDKFSRINELSDRDERVQQLLQEFKARASKADKIQQIYLGLVESVAKVYELDLASKAAWGLKNTESSQLEEFLESFPHGSVVHISRDPRGAFLSRMQSHKLKGRRIQGIKANAHSFLYIWAVMTRWLELETQVRDLRRRVGTDRVHIVYYEDLVTDSASESARIFDFLNLNAIDSQSVRPSRLGTAVQTDTASAPEKADAMVYRSSANRWVDELKFFTVFWVEALAVRFLKNNTYPRYILVSVRALLNIVHPFIRTLVMLFERSYQNKPKHKETYVCTKGHIFRWIHLEQEKSLENCIYCDAKVTRKSEPK